MTAARINTDFLRASEFVIPDDRNGISLILVGCGGTGSWLSPTVARVARLLAETKQKTVRTFFVDPDRVEAQNVYRQYFADAEIGMFKAETLAHRLSTAFGVEITAVCKEFDGSRSHRYGTEGTVVLIGCVDGPQGRIKMREYASEKSRRENVIWLDAGNRRTSGQVLLGGGAEPKKPFPFNGICTYLPLPSTQHPELVDEGYDSITEAAPAAARLSCADLALQGSQGLSVNQTVAAIAGHYLISMLVTGGLKTFQTYIDLASGTMSSTYILPRRVMPLLRQEKGREA